MAANRGEIAIRIFRSAHELGIRTVAIYSHEDRFAPHRSKADEAYEVGKPGEPIRSYLNIDGIVELARSKDVDAIHPGYGFLSENAEFARACAARALRSWGRGRRCSTCWATRWPRKLAREAGIPVLSGSDTPVMPGEAAQAIAAVAGLPGDRQGVDGRGRTGNARRRVGRCPRSRTRPGAARSGDRLRRPRRLYRKVHQAGQAYRGADPGRPAGQARSPF